MNKEKQKGASSANRDKIIKVQQLGEDDNFSELSRSEYSMEDVLDLAEFRSLSKEIHLHDEQQNRLVDSFYCPQWRPDSSSFQRRLDPLSIYSQEYSKWKGEQAREDAFKSTYASTLALVNKQQQRQEVDRLLKEYSIDQAIFSYSNQNPLLQINKEYSQSLATVTNKQLRLPSPTLNQVKNQDNLDMSNHSFKPNPVTTWKQNQSIERNQQKQAIIELEVQQQLLQRLKQINEQEKKEDLKVKKQKQLKKTCFKDLIQRPPNSNQKMQKSLGQQIKFQQTQRSKIINEQVNRQSSFVRGSNSSSAKEGSKKESHYRLNVEQILKIPHRLFLIFYSDNYHQIVRLSSPSDLKRINDYRMEALKRQEAVQVLKRKVAQEGSELVSKLPSQLKEKLFRVLYDQDVQEEKYAQDHQ